MNKLPYQKMVFPMTLIMLFATSISFSNLLVSHNGAAVLNTRETGECTFTDGFMNQSNQPGYPGELKIAFGSTATLWTNANGSAKKINFRGNYAYNTTVPVAGLTFKNKSGQVVASLAQSGDFFALGQLNAFYPQGWNGDDPFSQPAPTTAYYGSGDVDLNGIVNAADQTVVSSMVSGSTAWNFRADVDGNGLVDNSDVTLLGQCISGSRPYLPGQWNKLTTKNERVDWITKMVAIYRNSPYRQGYIRDWYVCGEFAAQMANLGTFNRADRSYPDENKNTGALYLNGHTFFNIPIYTYGCAVPPLGGTGNPDLHSDCMVLVGDDPRSSSDWAYIYCINGLVGTFPNRTVNGIGGPVSFDINGAFVSIRPGLQTTRRSQNVLNINNQSDTWHPIIVNAGDSYVFFEKQNSDNMTNWLDIYQTRIPISNNVAYPPGNGGSRIPIPGVSPVRYLLDARREGTTNRIHLVWRAKEPASTPRSGENGIPIKEPGLFYGIYDISSGTISSVARITPEVPHLIGSAKVIPLANGNVYIFFYKPEVKMTDIGNSNDPGLHRCLWNGTQWGAIEKITNVGLNFTACGNNNQVFLAYMDSDINNFLTQNKLLCYSAGVWSGPYQISTGSSDPSGYVKIFSLVSSASNLVHVAYLDYYENNRVKWQPHLCYRTFTLNGSTGTWGPSTTIEGPTHYWDKDGNYTPLVPESPVMSMDNAGGLHVIWNRVFRASQSAEVRSANERLCYSKYSSGNWLPATLVQWNPGIVMPAATLSFNSANKPVISFQENSSLGDNSASIQVHAGRLLNVPADFATLQIAASNLQTGDIVTVAGSHTETLAADLVFAPNQVVIQIPNGLNLNGRVISCTGKGSYLDASQYSGIAGRVVLKGMDGRIISIR